MICIKDEQKLQDFNRVLVKATITLRLIILLTDSLLVYLDTKSISIYNKIFVNCTVQSHKILRNYFL